MKKEDDLMYVTSSGIWKRSQPGAWAFGHPGKSQTKSKACHQQKPNPTGSKTNYCKTKGETSKGRRAKSPVRETIRGSQCKGNEEKADKIRIIEEIGNTLNLPVHRIDPNKKNFTI